MNLRTTIRRAGATVPAAPPRHRTATRVCSALLVLLLLAILAGMSVGSISVAPVTVATVLAASVFPHGWIDVSSVSEADRVVVWLIRTPRVLVAALVGAALALAGAQMQGLFHNPLASPDLVGTSVGGAFGAGVGDCLWIGHAVVVVRAIAGVSRRDGSPVCRLCDRHTAWTHARGHIIIGRCRPECLDWRGHIPGDFAAVRELSGGARDCVLVDGRPR